MGTTSFLRMAPCLVRKDKRKWVRMIWRKIPYLYRIMKAMRPGLRITRAKVVKPYRMWRRAQKVAKDWKRLPIFRRKWVESQMKRSRTRGLSAPCPTQSNCQPSTYPIPRMIEWCSVGAGRHRFRAAAIGSPVWTPLAIITKWVPMMGVPVLNSSRRSTNSQSYKKQNMAAHKEERRSIRSLGVRS